MRRCETGRVATGTLTGTALLLALGVVLPIVFHAIPLGGRIFLPMHLPTFVAGLVLGTGRGPCRRSRLSDTVRPGDRSADRVLHDPDDTGARDIRVRRGAAAPAARGPHEDTRSGSREHRRRSAGRDQGPVGRRHSGPDRRHDSRQGGLGRDRRVVGARDRAHGPHHRYGRGGHWRRLGRNGHPAGTHSRGRAGD